MNRLQRLKYQFLHTKNIVSLYLKFPEIEIKFLLRLLLHDIDKIYHLVILNKDAVSYQSVHRSKCRHHLEKLCEVSFLTVDKYDIIEMLLDWESARYSKKTKQLTAREYWKTIEDTMTGYVIYYNIIHNLEEYKHIFK